MAKPRTCAVIGGGVAGLACAQRLRARGVVTTVFDTGKRAPGGRASSRELTLPNGKLKFDHAAQFFTATGAFGELVRGWETEGIVRRWEHGLGELDARSGAFTEFNDSVDRWMGARSMGDVPAALARGLDVRQGAWVSPQGGVERVDGLWRVRCAGRVVGDFDAVAIAHNGKCAEKLSSGTPAAGIHRLLRARFAPALAKGGDDRLVLNSLYSLFFIVPEGLLPPYLKSLSGARVLHSPKLSFLTCHSRKRPESGRALGPGEEAWTVISSAAFGAAHKGPQEALPQALQAAVTAELLAAVAEAAGSGARRSH